LAKIRRISPSVKQRGSFFGAAYMQVSLGLDTTGQQFSRIGLQDLYERFTTPESGHNAV
jgi:hypothetical protein